MALSDVYPEEQCLNCGHHLPAGAQFCSRCGQKTGPPRITLKGLFSDFFDSVFNLNSKFFLSITRLFIPAYLTLEFFQGRQIRYMSPLRLFFVTLLGMYAVFGMTFLNGLESQISEDTSYLDYQVSKQAGIRITNAAYELGYDSFDLRHRQLIDSLVRRVGYTEEDTSVTLKLSLHRDSVVYLTPEEMYDLEIDSVLAQHRLTAFWDRLITRQLIKAQRAPAKVTQFIIANTSWMILLLVPALALCMKLIYFRRKRFLVEHVVFLFHYHAAVFVIVIVVLPIAQFLPSTVIPLTPVLCLAFLYVAMLRYYRQSWIRTLLKYFLVLMAYVGILMVFLVLTTFISLIIFQ